MSLYCEQFPSSETWRYNAEDNKLLHLIKKELKANKYKNAVKNNTLRIHQTTRKDFDKGISTSQYKCLLHYTASEQKRRV